MIDPKSSIDELVYSTISAVFRVSRDEIGPQTVAADVDGWDSVSHSLLFLALEEKLGVELPIDQLLECENVGELCRALIKFSGDLR